MPFALAACEGEAEPRPQLLVWLDTDLPVVGQIVTRPELSLDAAVDTLRVDVVSDDGTTSDVFVTVAPDPFDWPISFGVAADPGVTALLRVRLFRGRYAETRQWGGGLAPEPAAQLAVDRLIEMTVPDDGISTALVTLRGDCIGLPPRFGTPKQTCVDAARPAAELSDGIDLVALDAKPASRIGTWPAANEAPCPSEDLPAGSVCIRGGYSLLGDDELVGLSDGIRFAVDPYPLRPVVLSPFAMDRTELTVGRFRDLIAAQPDVLSGDELPQLRDETDSSLQHCSYLGPGDSANDELPLNCVTRLSAIKICEALGGSLPSEARWEHAARGRGQHLAYPWGSEWPACCSAVLARAGGGCPGPTPAAVASTLDAGCTGPVDVSRDGIVDLAGNLREMTLDSLIGYHEGCWAAPGVLRDPLCLDESVEARIDRGSYWRSARDFSLLPLRATGFNDAQLVTLGFRCVYSLQK